MTTKQCQKCSVEFHITESDDAFYKKMKVPQPTLCPSCRSQRKLAHINQLNLYKRICDATGEAIISNHPSGNGYTVFSQKHWYSDAYDGTNYGRDYDFTKTFFEQYSELSREVPRPALFTDFLNDENCNYTNYAGRNKNCYLIFDSDECWDSYYSYGLNSSKDTSDCFRCRKLELCYEAIDCNGCYNCYFIQNSENCTDSAFLNNCIGCKNTIFCSNLKQKEHYIFNKPASKKKYEEFRENMGSYSFLEEKIAKFEDYKKQFPQKFLHGFQNEGSTGDYLVNCKNAEWCFDSTKIWDGKYCNQIFMPARDIMDCDEVGEFELGYECTNSGFNLYNMRFVMQSLHENKDLTYCDLCHNGCKHLFGCIGLKRKQYCILNKQYSKEEYEILIPKIIEHMKETGEWGEFFPASISPFGYNLSRAQDHFPLTKEEALAQGFKWHDEDPREFQPQTYEIPDHINDIPNSICNETLACIECGKNYKITEQELKFYKQRVLPIPRKCFLCRNKARRALRNPRSIWQRSCDKCSLAINTTYSPDRSEKVYCEKCYLESLD